MKKLTVFLAVILLVSACFGGCNGNASASVTEPTPTQLEEFPAEIKHFSVNGIHFDLTVDFTDYTDNPINQDNTFYFANPNWGLLGSQEPKTAGAFLNFEEYLARQEAFFGCNASQKDGLWTATYLDDSQNETQYCLCVFYESADSYWTVTARCPETVFETYQEAMWDYASSATFD